MYCVDMSVPVGGCIEGCVTMLTFVRFFVGVNVLMLPEMRLYCKAFRAEAALVRLLTIWGMNVDDMIIQYHGSAEEGEGHHK